MTCPRCQAANRDGARFCRECGATFPAVCAACGAKVEAGSKFCDSCGAPLAATPPQPAAAAPRFGPPESYTPKHLADKILTSRAALEGERKQVTVLFADLKGSMELLADRDPEEARKLLDPVLERMMEAVHRYEGTVNQVMGDGIMALFGAPVAHEDHAVRACYAALDMQTALHRYAEEVRRTHGLGGVAIRAGLNSGEVVVRAIGSDLRMDYTAVGQTTHLAARMEQLASPGTTLLTAGTLRLAEGFIAVKPLGPIPVKGLDAPVEVYEMTGAGAMRSRLHAAAARGLTRFVGRDSELEQLRQALGHAAARRGQVVAIVGEPGVGKSRLVWEVTHSHRVHGWLILQAGSVSYGKATSYLPVIDLLKGYFAIEDRDGPRVVQEKLTGKLLTLDRALEGGLPALLSLLDVPADDPQWAALDPSQRRRRTLDAVKRLLLRESQLQPLLMVFEDLHWIDSETQALLDALVESLPAARLLLLVNYRPEYSHQWGNRTYYTQLRLDPLPPETADQLLGALLGPDTGLEPLTRALIARTEGNPFFLEESVRALAETGSLLGERGAYRLARPLQTIQVPATVQAVLAARIDRLPPGDKALLQTASVVGKDVPFALLQAVAEPPEEGVHAAIGRLQAAEFLYETSLFPDLEYTFKHALTHEVAYGSLLQERRRTLHARIVEGIEGRYPGRLAEHVERLAHHAFRGEVWTKALTYLRQAGTKALSRSAYREAAAWFEQALVALARHPEGAESVAHPVDVRLQLCHALNALGELGPEAECLREAEALAERLGDQRRAGLVAAHMALHWRYVHDYDRVIEYGHRALDVAKALQDVGIQVLARPVLAVTHEILGDYPRAIELLKRSVGDLQGARLRERFDLTGLPSVICRAHLARILGEVGAFAEGVPTGAEAIRIAESVDDPYSLVQACGGSGCLYLFQGNLSRAIAVLERGGTLCRDLDFAAIALGIFAPLGRAYALSGRLADAVPLLERSVEQGPSTGWFAADSLWSVWLGEAYLDADRVHDAMNLAERALDLSRKRKARGFQAWALRLLGEIASRRDSPDLAEAEVRYRDALALANELGMRPLVAHCHLGLGKLYRRTGDGANAEEHLTTARAMYQEMDMGFWLAQAEAAGAGGEP
jgi:class 3 adenylate cyclase/tetratricopeptide (TPR) repeat protein